MQSPVEVQLQPLKRLLDNENYIELVCRSRGEVFAETRTGKWKRFGIPEINEAYWNKIARGVGMITGQRFRESKPVLRGTLPGGHRIFLMTGTNVLNPETAGTGLCVTIRLKRCYALDIDAFGMDKGAITTLRNAIHGRKNVLVAGGMGSGKTTLTRVLCTWIKEDRPISIEDSPELELPQPVSTQFVVSAVESDTDITNRDIVSNIQRSRGDRFILGEITMENAFILMRLLNLGSPGTLGTIHCDFANEAIESIAILLDLSGYTKNREATIAYLQSKIHLVAFCERAGPVRVVSELYAPDHHHPEGGQYVWRRG